MVSRFHDRKAKPGNSFCPSRRAPEMEKENPKLNTRPSIPTKIRGGPALQNASKKKKDEREVPSRKHHRDGQIGLRGRENPLM